MDAGGWVMDAGTRPISRVGRRDVRCGNTRCLLRQGKTSVVARHKGTTKGGGRLRRPPLLCGGGRRPPPLCVATTEVLPCRNRHLVLPQRTSRLPTREIGRVPASITHPPASITHPPASISIHQHASCIKHHAACILYHPSLGGQKIHDFSFFLKMSGGP